MSKVAAEAASEMLKTWEADFDVELSEDEEAPILKAIRAGRLDFDADTGEFLLSLIRPVELANGDSVEELTLSEPDMGQLRKALASKEAEQSIKLLAACTGQPAGVLDRLKARDANAALGVLAFCG
jgi:hypothetical protein